MSLIMMAKAFKVKVGNPTRKLVLIKLADHANDDGDCFPSYQHIADHCEISRRTAVSHVDALCKAGYLTKQHRAGPKGNTSNMYRVSLGGEIPAPPSEIPAPPPGENSAPRITHSFESSNESNPRSTSDDVTEIFNHWRETMQKTKRTALDSNRKRLIAKALENYSKDDVKAAITGCSLSPYHMGQNDSHKRYDGLSLILRNAEKIEQFMAFAEQPPAEPTKSRHTGIDGMDTSNLVANGDGTYEF